MTDETIEYMDCLKSQYQCALELYKHEDVLNWSKIRAFLYANGLIAASYGFGQVPMEPYVRPIIGFILSVILGFSLFNGHIHIRDRREHLILLDKKLLEYSGNIGMKEVKTGLIQTMPTILILVGLTCVFWLVVLGKTIPT